MSFKKGHLIAHLGPQNILGNVQGKRKPSKMVGVERGNQRADTLKS